MRLWTINPEIREATIGAYQLRSDAGIGGLKSGRVESWPPLADASGEAFLAAGFHGVVFLFDPLYIRTETGLASEIESQVDTQAPGFRNRIDQGPERCSSAVAEVDAPREPLPGNAVVGQTCPVFCQRDGAEPGGVNDIFRFQN